jgi:hypothetical protein
MQHRRRHVLLGDERKSTAEKTRRLLEAVGVPVLVND